MLYSETSALRVLALLVVALCCMTNSFLSIFQSKPASYKKSQENDLIMSTESALGRHLVTGSPICAVAF